MLFIYDLLSVRFGDNKSTKIAFRVIQIILATIAFALLVCYSVLKYDRVNYFLIFICFMIWSTCLFLILRANNTNLHTGFKLPKKKEFYGGKLTPGQLHYENILQISFDNGFEVSLVYQNEEYHAVLKNDEWDNVEEISSSDRKEISDALSELCRKASEMTPSNENYEIVENFDEEEIDMLEGKTYEGRHMLGHDSYEDELINQEMYGAGEADEDENQENHEQENEN